MTHYQAINVPPCASLEEIKSAFRKLAMQHHPDKNGDPHTFSLIHKAYAVLSDPVKRREYDESMKRRPVNDLQQLASALSTQFCNS